MNNNLLYIFINVSDDEEPLIDTNIASTPKNQTRLY